MTTDERLARIETMVEDTHHRLFGNGQPGAIDKLDARVGALEAWKWKAAGALVVLSVLFGAMQAFAK